MRNVDPLCTCGHDRLGHRIERPHPCKSCGCAQWRRDFDRERSLREIPDLPETTNELITPQRAKEIRRAAARHAAGMILVSLVEWAPQEYAEHDARNDAEEALLREEVGCIADEIRARALVGTPQPCGSCGFPYTVRTDGTMHFHHGVTPAGFSSGERCPGVGEPPRAN